MRDLDSGKAPDKTKQRVPASRVPSIAPNPAVLSQAAALTPEHMIALQRSVGNAAVLRALQRETHHHSAGCGHGEQSFAQIQRNAVQEALQSKPTTAGAVPAQQRSADQPAVTRQPAVQRAPMPGNNWDKALVFDRSKDAIRYGRETWGPAMNTMSEGKKLALEDYTAEPKADFELGHPTYRETNKYLRGQYVENAGKDGIDMVKSQVKALRKALDVQPLPNNVIVARGSNFLPDGMDKSPWQMAGRRYTELGFLSTSLGPSPVGGYKDKPFIFRFRVPKGTPAMWMEFISHFGSGELELLLKDHCEYKVDKVTPEKNKYGKTQWYIDATIQKPSDQVVEEQVKKAEKTGKYVVQHGSHQGGSHQYASSHHHNYPSSGAPGHSKSKYPAKY